MKHLLRFAVGAVTAGILVNVLLKRRSSDARMAAAGGEDEVRTSVDEMMPGTDTVSDTPGPQTQDWRSGQKVLDS